MNDEIDVSEFYDETNDMWLLDADLFISEMKSMVQNELKKGELFGMYVGVNRENQFEFWVRTSNGEIYKLLGDHDAFNDDEE